jgi:2-polyprenyl-6-methoxyphenol hydroxylase-like FAD-dependent oxidoreductase
MTNARTHESWAYWEGVELTGGERYSLDRLAVSAWPTNDGLTMTYAGDAGLLMDPITGAGIGHALRDAELLGEALADGLGGRRPVTEALASYEAERNRQTLPVFARARTGHADRQRRAVAPRARAVRRRWPR